MLATAQDTMVIGTSGLQEDAALRLASHWPKQPAR